MNEMAIKVRFGVDVFLDRKLAVVVNKLTTSHKFRRHRTDSRNSGVGDILAGYAKN